MYLILLGSNFLMFFLLTLYIYIYIKIDVFDKSFHGIFVAHLKFVKGNLEKTFTNVHKH